MHVLDKSVVGVPVLLFAEELGNYDYVIVLHRSCIAPGGGDLGFRSVVFPLAICCHRLYQQFQILVAIINAKRSYSK